MHLVGGRPLRHLELDMELDHPLGWEPAPAAWTLWSWSGVLCKAVTTYERWSTRHFSSLDLECRI